MVKMTTELDSATSEKVAAEIHGVTIPVTLPTEIKAKALLGEIFRSLKEDAHKRIATATGETIHRFTPAIAKMTQTNLETYRNELNIVESRMAKEVSNAVKIRSEPEERTKIGDQVMELIPLMQLWSRGFIVDGTPYPEDRISHLYDNGMAHRTRFAGAPEETFVPTAIVTGNLVGYYRVEQAREKRELIVSEANRRLEEAKKRAAIASFSSSLDGETDSDPDSSSSPVDPRPTFDEFFSMFFQ